MITCRFSCRGSNISICNRSSCLVRCWRGSWRSNTHTVFAFEVRLASIVVNANSSGITFFSNFVVNITISTFGHTCADKTAKICVVSTSTVLDAVITFFAKIPHVVAAHWCWSSSGNISWCGCWFCGDCTKDRSRCRRMIRCIAGRFSGRSCCLRGWNSGDCFWGGITRRLWRTDSRFNRLNYGHWSRRFSSSDGLAASSFALSFTFVISAIVVFFNTSNRSTRNIAYRTRRSLELEDPLSLPLLLPV